MQRDSEESMARQRILELIDNLESKNIKFSEENKALVRECMNGTNEFAPFSHTLTML